MTNISNTVIVGRDTDLHNISNYNLPLLDAERTRSEFTDCDNLLTQPVILSDVSLAFHSCPSSERFEVFSMSAVISRTSLSLAHCVSDQPETFGLS